MKLNTTPRRLLQLDALFAGRGLARELGEAREPVFEDTCMPDDAETLAPQRLTLAQLGRIAAEVALEEGERRQYAPRREAEVLELRRRR